MDSDGDVGLERDMKIWILEYEVCQLKQKIKDQNRLINQLDEEAGRRFDMVDEDQI